MTDGQIVDTIIEANTDFVDRTGREQRGWAILRSLSEDDILYAAGQASSDADWTTLVVARIALVKHSTQYRGHRRPITRGTAGLSRRRPNLDYRA